MVRINDDDNKSRSETSSRLCYYIYTPIMDFIMYPKYFWCKNSFVIKYERLQNAFFNELLIECGSYE